MLILSRNFYLKSAIVYAPLSLFCPIQTIILHSKCSGHNTTVAAATTTPLSLLTVCVCLPRKPTRPQQQQQQQMTVANGEQHCCCFVFAAAAAIVQCLYRHRLVVWCTCRSKPEQQRRDLGKILPFSHANLASRDSKSGGKPAPEPIRAERKRCDLSTSAGKQRKYQRGKIAPCTCPY